MVLTICICDSQAYFFLVTLFLQIIGRKRLQNYQNKICESVDATVSPPHANSVDPKWDKKKKTCTDYLTRQ